jgi:hypothetical protein
MTTPIRIEKLLQQMAGIKEMERGTLSTIRQTPQGPCCNFQRREDGRHISEYIPATKVEEVQEHLQAYEQFQGLVDQYVQLVSQRSREQRLAGVKKKRHPPSSSSPKKPKSTR